MSSPAAPPRRLERLLPGPFGRLWIASAVSNLGDGVTLVAAPLLAAALTRDPLAIAGLTVAQRLPWLLFSLLTGALADLVDRRRAVRAANALWTLALAVLAGTVALGVVTLPVLYAAFFVLGVAETLFDNAAAALLTGDEFGRPRTSAGEEQLTARRTR